MRTKPRLHSHSVTRKPGGYRNPHSFSKYKLDQRQSAPNLASPICSSRSFDRPNPLQQEPNLPTLFISRLHSNVTHYLLHELILQAAPVHNLYMRKNGTAIVHLEHEESLKYTCELLDGLPLFNTPIRVVPYVRKSNCGNFPGYALRNIAPHLKFFQNRMSVKPQSPSYKAKKQKLSAVPVTRAKRVPLPSKVSSTPVAQLKDPGLLFSTPSKPAPSPVVSTFAFPLVTHTTQLAKFAWGQQPVDLTTSPPTSRGPITRKKAESVQSSHLTPKKKNVAKRDRKQKTNMKKRQSKDVIVLD